MTKSEVRFSRFLARLPRMRGMSKEQLELNGINRARFRGLTAALKSGWTVDIDLGCGDGEFAARLSERTKRWTIGIEQNPVHLLQSTDSYSLNDYKRAERFLYLPFSYDFILRDWDSLFSWLQGKANRTFMIMPYPGGDYSEEAALWKRSSIPHGALYVKTEKSDILDKVESQIGLHYELEAFPGYADNIMTRHLRDFIPGTLHLGYSHQPIVSRGFRLVD